MILFNGNKDVSRGGSRTAATSKMERFVIIVNGLAVLDPPLVRFFYHHYHYY